MCYVIPCFSCGAVMRPSGGDYVCPRCGECCHPCGEEEGSSGSEQ